MAARRVPMGFKIAIGVTLFIISFLLVRPSSPATTSEYAFWNKAANLFGENDVEGFVGTALLIICTLTTIIGYPIAIRLIERRLNRKKE